MGVVMFISLLYFFGRVVGPDKHCIGLYGCLHIGLCKGAGPRDDVDA